MPVVECDVLDEDAPSERSDHDTDTEKSAAVTYNKLCCIEKDGMNQWSYYKHICRSKTCSKNIVTILPAVTSTGKITKIYKDRWK